MGKTERWFCDRCKKKVPGGVNLYRAKVEDGDSCEICLECTVLFQEWMRGGSSSSSSTEETWVDGVWVEHASGKPSPDAPVWTTYTKQGTRPQGAKKKVYATTWFRCSGCGAETPMTRLEDSGLAGIRAIHVLPDGKTCGGVWVMERQEGLLP